MDRLAVFRPHRRLALPFVVAFAPMVWFVARDVSGATPHLAAAPVLQFVALTSAAGVASYFLAALTAGVVSLAERPARTVLPEPDDATLAIFAGLVAVGLGYVAITTFVAVPWWFDLLVAPVGMAVSLPLVALYGGFIVVSNAVPGLERGLAPFAVVTVGVACSALWAYLIASILAGRLDRS